MASPCSQATVMVLAGLTASCGVRAPRPLDVQALVRAQGAVEARRTLAVRVIAAPRDVAARLALARLADEAGRPSEAIDQLEAVLRLGGPAGTRWHRSDRARFARLIAARGRLRLDRGSAMALADLARAQRYGAPIDTRELQRARAAVALWELRHVDGKLRAHGRATLAALSMTAIADPSWLGAKPTPVPRDRGLFGVWLWTQGARRAAWEALADWRATTSVRGGELHAAYLRAYAWWTPSDGPTPPAEDLIGPERCRFATAPGCDAATVAAEGDPVVRRALLRSPLGVVAVGPDDMTAWAAITLDQALQGDGGWGRALAARVDLRAADHRQLPPHVVQLFGRLGGRMAARAHPVAGEAASTDRLLAAAVAALDGISTTQLHVALGDLAETPAGRALTRIVAPMGTAPVAPYTVAVRRFVHARGATALDVDGLVAGYARDPAIADRIASDAVASAGDAAVAHAAIGAVFAALGDPARSRAAWEAAVAASPEPAFVRGLAEALARAGDPDAALIHATTAAAASGDPAPVWIEVARALDDVGHHVHALEAGRYALELAGEEALGPALDVAISASQALGRDRQVTALRARRAKVAPGRAANPADPTDAGAMLAAHRAAPTPATIDRLWLASRWNPRDVASRAALRTALAALDPRREVVIAELVALAGARDVADGRAAVAALR